MMSERKITLSGITATITQLSPEQKLLLMGILQGMQMADAASASLAHNSPVVEEEAHKNRPA